MTRTSRWTALLLGLWAAAGAQAAADIPNLPWTPRSDWLSAKADGAVGDGVADDTAALQKLLDRAGDGVTLFLPPGTYRVSTTLTLRGPHTGLTLIGCGRATRLTWAGPAGGKMILVDGFANSRFRGFELDGGGSCGVGLWHKADHRFETEVDHRDIAFRGFTDAGLLRDPTGKQSLAETIFDNCLFDHCHRGVAFPQFNDYDYTFEGCEFRDCDTGVETSHGNAYVRDCHFERSTDADIKLFPEHGSSVRRCTSRGSKRFLIYSNSVAPVTVEDCRVAAWGDPAGAVQLGGAPVMLFDCDFSQPPAGAKSAIRGGGGQRLLLSGNTAFGLAAIAAPGPKIYEILPGRRGPVLTSADQTWFRDSAAVPSKVIDVKADFGAKGDGRTDDTAAVQAAIDAAKAAGGGALAYLPSGTYLVKQTLTMTGADYAVGGTGFGTRLLWRGAAGGTILAVRDPQHLRLENLIVGSHDAGAMDNAIDIEQTDTGGPSAIWYDDVSVFGMYQRQPERKGLWLNGLGSGAVVRLGHLQGNIHVIDSSSATIIGDCTYEGSLTVDGAGGRRDGLLGILTRLCTVSTAGLYLRHNHSLVASDFYVEQADNGYVLEGAPDDPPGRLTLQGAKLQFTPTKNPADGVAFTIKDWAGQVFLGPDQFYCEPKLAKLRHEGQRPVDFWLLGTVCYNTKLDFTGGPGLKLWRAGNLAVGDTAGTAGNGDLLPDEGVAAVAAGLDDLRRLGEADVRVNHGG
jgi:hypothetical protein